LDHLVGAQLKRLRDFDEAARGEIGPGNVTVALRLVLTLEGMSSL
jgi:hypothetical protein